MIRSLKNLTYFVNVNFIFIFIKLNCSYLSEERIQWSTLYINFSQNYIVLKISIMQITNIENSFRVDLYLQLKCLCIQGLNPAVCEPSRIIFDSKKTRTASDSSTPVRSSTSSKASSTGKLPAGGVVPTSARYKRIQELQNHFLVGFWGWRTGCTL